jgi:hypothetical protein
MKCGRYAVWVLVAIAFGAGLALGSFRLFHHAGIKQQPRAHAHLRARVHDGVPYVDAEIESVLASPDFTRIAMVLKSEVKSEDAWAVAVFDPVAERIIFRESSDLDWATQWAWSPDGKWLAAVIGKGLALVDKQGRFRLVNKHGLYPAWRGSGSRRLAYVTRNPDAFPEVDRGEVREYDTATGRERAIRRLRSANNCIGVFGTRGRLCAAYVRDVPGGLYPRDRIEVVDLDSGRGILGMREYEQSFDYEGFDMSPDGNAFAIKARVSGSTFLIIGRTSDAATTLKHLNRAVFFESGQGNFSVAWATNSSRGPVRDVRYDVFSSNPKYALVNGDTLPMVIDLETGDRGYPLGYLCDV